MSTDWQGIRRTAAATVAATVAAGALTASPAQAATCGQTKYGDRVQADNNAAGAVFVRKGDKWKLWDNQRDEWLVRVEYNYAGVDDAWKKAAMHADGGQGTVVHNVSERYKYLCFRLYSPRFGYTRAVRSRT
ncbi:MAG TPA: hypothetical protein VNO82_23435 [Solirubrobacteraceae bacterium]|nr:hypothetical protein [Solirubrobacteraceae bacterium]